MNKQRACLFCQRSGHCKLTYEHAWPQWLVTKRGAIIENFHKDYQTGEMRKWNSRGKLAIGTNDVCEECNNGWMAALEEGAQKLIRPLMSGRLTVRLTVTDQEILRSWILKTAMMLDASNPAKGRYFMNSERESFWRRRLPPENTAGTVVMGVYAGSRHGVYSMMFHRVRQFLQPESGEQRAGHIYSCTLQMERFLAQVLSVRGLDGPLGPRITTGGEKWRPYVFPIVHPKRATNWPVVRGVRDEELEAFTDRWHIYSSEPGKGPTTLSEF
jgi:hypothetical protein